MSMFNISMTDDGSVIIEGRLDAANSPPAQEFLDTVQGPCTLDLGKLEYISSAGLGVLLRTHKRLVGSGDGLRMINVSKHINDIFGYSGFDHLFEIHPADPTG